MLRNLPSDRDIALSAACHADTFYRLPRIVQCFVDRARQELPGDFWVEPQTLNRSVSIFRGGEFVLSVAYDDIEVGIVCELDRLKELL